MELKSTIGKHTDNQLALNCTYFILYAGISIYKIYYSVWIGELNKLHYYTIAYCSQAIASLIAYYMLYYIHRYISTYSIIIISAFLTGAGVLLSTITTGIYCPIVSGFITGLGLFSFFYTMNNLLKALTASNNFLHSNMINNLGRLFGITTATLLIFIYSLEISSLHLTILIGGGLVISSVIPMLCIKKSKFNKSALKHIVPPISISKFIVLYATNKLTINFIILINYFVAFCINILIPFFPVILFKSNESILTIGATMGIGWLITGITQYSLAKYSLSKYAKSIFIGSNVLMLILTLLMYSSNISYPIGIILFFLLYGIISIFRRLIENKIVSKEISSDWFSIAIIASMLGNISGAIAGGYLFCYNLNHYAFLTSSIAIAFSILISIVYFRKIHQNTIRYLSN